MENPLAAADIPSTAPRHKLLEAQWVVKAFRH
jgi:hypothetical protein